MKRVSSLFLLSLLICSASVHAQLYRSVGPDGKVTYSDTPPSSAKRVVEKPTAPGTIPGTGELPFELSESMRNHPVVLYTSKDCEPCDQGRNFLGARGIPYSEKTVNNLQDVNRLRQAAGDDQVPLLMVGRNRVKGFSETTWNSALSAANYPETSKLPRGYRNPPPAPAVPVAADPARAAEARQAAEAPPPINDTPPPAGNAPPGFRF